LEVFGEEVSRTVRDLLTDRGIRLVTQAHPAAATREGLALRFAGTLEADHIVAIPQLAGPAIGGIGGDWNGFVGVDARGRVEGLTDVFAAGDMTDSPLKQGGLAAQAADEIAHTIAAELGVRPSRTPRRCVLRAR